MQIDLLQGSLLCTLEHGEMHYITEREDLDARRFCRHISFKVMLRAKPIYVIRHHWLVLKFCRQQFNPPEGHRATITIALSFNYMSSNNNVEPSILSPKCIVTQAPCSPNSLSSTKRPFCRRGWLKSEQFAGFWRSSPKNQAFLRRRCDF